MTKPVPNLHPIVPAAYRIAFVGEAPGSDESLVGQPFVGMAGRLLRGLLAKSDINPNACFYGNICQHQPPAGKDSSAFAPSGPEFTSGLAALTTDLASFDPHLVVLLGNAPLRIARSGPETVSALRGSLFRSTVAGPFLGRKCLPTYHPAACLRQRDWIPVFRFDLSKVAREGVSPDLNLPLRTLTVDLPLDDIIRRLDSLVARPRPISIDIEGGLDSMSCISVAESSTDVFIVPFEHSGGRSYWIEGDEARLWRALARVLTDRRIPKILQNSLYDNFVLSYSYRLPILNVADDTMLKHWELYSELPKSLAFQASLYTDEPYYKSERTVPDTRTHYLYCCKDSAVTYEINSHLSRSIGTGSARDHYRFNVNLLPALLYMEVRGIRYNVLGAAARRKRIGLERDYFQCLLDIEAGREINTKSPTFKTYLYEELGLPQVTNRTTGKPTANAEALLNIAKKTNHIVPRLGLFLSDLRTRHQMLGIESDGDGRIRCGYNLVGTETGRLTCYTSPTGSGYNLQTIPERDRDLFLADDGCWLFQCDLSGADTWTVAAHCAVLGDHRMLLDLRAGVKPAKALAYAFRFGGDILSASSEEVLEKTNVIPKTDPLYFGAKCCIHGSNYGMGKVLLSQTIFKQSDGSVNISAADAQKLQDLYFRRYPGVLRWHSWIKRQLSERSALVSASGHRRLFLGDPNDHATFKQALANEPQENTTYATNLAAARLWNDPANRRPDGSLIVEPLHQVHDALVGQFPKSETAFAVRKIKEWFDNRMVIGGMELIIPFEGTYGDSWGEQNGGKL